METLAIGPGSTLAAADTNGNTYLWSITTKHLLATLPSRGGRPLSVAFGPDGTLAVGDITGHTYVWRISSIA